MGRERRPTVGMGVGVHEHVPESICQSTILQTATSTTPPVAESILCLPILF